MEEIITEWATTIDLYSETDGLKLLKILEQYQTHTQYFSLKASLLGLLSNIRMKRLGKIDQLSEKWAETALHYNEEEKLAGEIIANIQLEKSMNLLNELMFPLIRETDNRQGKRTVAQQYIQTSDSFLDEIEQHYQLFQTGLRAARLVDNKDLEETYSKLHGMLIQLEKSLASLVQYSTNFINSLAGNFHSSNYVTGMKEAISEVEELKRKWIEQFDQSETDTKQSCLTELENMIGLNEIKEKVRKLYHFLQYQQLRKSEGYQFKDELQLHMILTGNPGTGKTTLARLFAKIYHELGIFERSEITEVDRSHLVGSYVGQTEENVMNIVKQAQGGVLFIDEAYSLRRDGQSGNDYGQTAIDTLVSAMTSGEYAGTFAVILAGYPEEMRQFLWSNPGLRSRFPESNHFHLDDYSTEELIQIATKTGLENDFVLTEEALLEIEHRIDKERIDESFGNARTVKNILMDAVFQKGAKLAEKQVLDVIDFTIIDKEDVELKESSDHTSTSYERLERLVGLDVIKKEVKTLTAFVKLQQRRRESGLKTVPIHLHSVFSGNPGTGKTTVAEIFSHILKDSGLLKRGHVVTASRADLVAGYIGQTALKTKKKIREALGGVLFIDEAYSLMSMSQNDFGKEAIDTLVEEMTKHENNLVVILAGYPKLMKELLEFNPGLASRFKKFFDFPDYLPEELTALTTSYAESYSYKLDEETKNELTLYYQTQSIEGNGRFVTNLVDETIQKQAYRIMIEENDEQLSHLKLCDFRAAIEDRERD
ncbi:hypothetical protein BFG57_15610 [Bacillus solimangrovi]|uniref:AAA+ ATPase domain-containing protein n=1 Tax=Bacillus solimangrovi TaxID=1305675 RepID=A0A1E5LEL1_9BACI|nr:hypothetical protein BFG57_15610 [Bacillus solimangrovi]